MFTQKIVDSYGDHVEVSTGYLKGEGCIYLNCEEGSNATVLCLTYKQAKALRRAIKDAITYDSEGAE